MSPEILSFLIRLPYALNILILLPVSYVLLRIPVELQATNRIFAIAPDAYRILTTSFWVAILLVSILGLAYPFFCAPVLLIQIIYKTLYLLLAELPARRAGQSALSPAGLIISFIFIVITYPFLFYLIMINSPIY